MIANANAASVALFSDEKVLLIKRALPPYAGYWTLPGGRRLPRESAELCAKREIFEELGIHLDELIAVDRFGASKDFVLQIFAARWNETKLSLNHEIADWRLITLEELALLKTTPHLAGILERAKSMLNKS